MTTNFFTENADLVEVFDKVVPWTRVVRAVGGVDANVPDTVSTWRDVLELAVAIELIPKRV